MRTPRQAQLIALQAALHDAVRASEAPSTTATRAAAAVPPPPPGMKWLATPKDALDARAGDAALWHLAFARYALMRTLLGARRPTAASLVACAHALRGLALYRLAVRAHADGAPLPLRSGGKSAREVPAWAVSPHLKHLKHLKHAKRLRKADISRAAGEEGGAGGDVAADLPIPEPIPSSAFDDLPLAEELGTLLGLPQEEAGAELAPEEVALLDAAGWWEQWGDLAALPADALSLLGSDDYDAAGSVLTFGDVLAALSDVGLSDMAVAQLVDAAWNGQAVLWAGNGTYADAGVQAPFDIKDPAFYDYLRNASGFQITQIDEYTRRSLADDLWRWLGGPDGTPAMNPDQLAAAILRDYVYELQPFTRFQADWRAYMIAVTETARAESFGNFLSMWTLGAKRKRWLVTAGACLICIGNEEAGSIPLIESFPSGVQAPPGHPICRCACSASVPESWSPDDFTPRDPSELQDFLFNWQGAAWPNVDLSGLGGLGDAEMGDIDTSDIEGRAAHAPKRRPLVDVAALERFRRVGGEIAALALRESERWAREAHLGLIPVTEDALRLIAKRLRAGHDELPDLREADEQYVHRLREGIAGIVRTLKEGGHE